MFSSLYDAYKRFNELDKSRDPLAQLNDLIPWDMFRKDLERIRKHDYSKGGRRPYDVILMFKILIIQSLYNLSDDALEFQINDRISFMRFLGLGLGDKIPDAKTVWLFREKLKEDSVIEVVFSRFDMYLRENGYSAHGGQIVDATIVESPKQRNNRDDNKKIKDGEVPEDWEENKLRQKDTEARWTQKNGKSYYGYKNHISIDNKNKLIRCFKVTPANEHDGEHFHDILDEGNTSKAVYADSAYGSKKNVTELEANGYIDKTVKKGSRHVKLSKNLQKKNHKHSKTRCRVEHVFGVMQTTAKDVTVRTIGKARAYVKLGLRNLTYNMRRYCVLEG